ncbi:uncharacterized protein TA08860 [Theileria annulata]|uniref:Uncharacterized protein n=1 Tax=Theileria annulata TaxID=5874 RepID=Q4U9F0_THEAN|nr:uncharacterized protein TA08860 [Theileria annulata]CAI76553.1 hypothetical protein TA08860 [Theileria annulata]|eukprot:XP_953178.1 hypothetical protein TA08860 [Theileria annulata]
MNDVTINFLEKLHKSYESKEKYHYESNSYFSTSIFKHFDYCSNYLLIVSVNKYFKGCLDSPALFTLVNQQFTPHNLGISVKYKLLVTIKCEYLDTDNSISCYYFNVSLDTGNSQFHYVKNLSVNLNGSVLLLYSDTYCFIASTPFEISQYVVENHGNCRRVFVKKVIQGQQILKKQTVSNSIVNVVKAIWNPLHSNTFVITTNELISEDYRNGSEDAETDVVDDSHPEKVRNYSFLRLFNLDNSIDKAEYTIKVSEQMCRLGHDGKTDISEKFQTKFGVFVDMFWNCNDTSTFGSYTMYVLSNYGYVFCYCPISINQICDTTKNIPMVRKTLELMKEGFTYKFDNSDTTPNNFFNNHENNYELVLKIQDSLFSHDSSVTYYPIIIRLISDCIPDCKFSYSYPTYQSLLVLSTEPLVILVCNSNSKLQVFESNLQLYPSNSIFYNKNILYRVNHCKLSHSMEFDSDEPFYFQYISDSDFIYYSRNESYHINYKHKLSFKPFITKSHQGVFSPPIVIKSNMEGLEFEYNNPFHIIIAQKYYCDSEIQVLDSFLFYKLFPFPKTNVGTKLNDTSQSSISFESGKTTLTIVKPNTDLFEKIRNSRNMVNRYKSIFETMRKLNKSTDIKEKAIGIMENMAMLHSEVIANLDSAHIYQQAVEEYVRRNEQASVLIENHFRETIEHYHTIFNNINDRIQNVVKTREYISNRRLELKKMIDLYERVKGMDNSLDYYSNMITELYLRYSRIILIRLDENLENSDYSSSFEMKKQFMIDEWFRNTFKENVDLMHRLFNRIKTIRAVIDSIN